MERGRGGGFRGDACVRLAIHIGLSTRCSCSRLLRWYSEGEEAERFDGGRLGINDEEREGWVVSECDQPSAWSERCQD